VTGYKVFRNGSQIATTPTPTYSDIGLPPLTSYTYAVSAYDAAGNSSSQSGPVAVATQGLAGLGYTILKASTSPTLDGDLSEYSSANATTFSLPSGTAVTVRALWDAQALYLAYEVADSKLNATVTTRNGGVWNDDSVEWFIDTQANGGGSGNPNSPYMLPGDYHGIINILNTQYDSQGTASGSPSSSWNGNWQSAVKLYGTPNNNGDADIRYTVEVRIPWTTLGYATAPVDNTFLGMSFAVNDNNGSSVSSVMWPNITTGAFENASQWKKVLLSGAAATQPLSSTQTLPAGVVQLNEAVFTQNAVMPASGVLYYYFDLPRDVTSIMISLVSNDGSTSQDMIVTDAQQPASCDVTDDVFNGPSAPAPWYNFIKYKIGASITERVVLSNIGAKSGERYYVTVCNRSTIAGSHTVYWQGY